MVDEKGMQTICALSLWIQQRLLSIVCGAWFCDGNMETNNNTINTSTSSNRVYMGSGIMDHQEEVANAIAMRHGLLQKNIDIFEPS